MTPWAHARWQWLFLAEVDGDACYRRFQFPLDSGSDCRLTVVMDVPVPLNPWGRVELRAPWGRVELRAEDKCRLACHALIAQIKDRGLVEAVESLRDMVEFYGEEPLPVIAPPVRSVQAKVGRSYTSTVPPFVEE